MVRFENLKVGLKGVAQIMVNEESSAERFAKPMVPAFATPMLVSLMDSAAINAVKDYLPEGYITVATKISIVHIAATPLGMAVTAESTLVDIFQNRLTFEVAAFDEMEKVGEGTVERYIIDLEKFTRQMLERKRPRGEVIN